MQCRAANFTENVPLALILMGFTEFQNIVPSWIIGVTGVLFLYARLCHAYSFMYLHEMPIHLKYRVRGTVMTVSFIVSYSCILLGNAAYQGVKPYL